MLTSYCSNLYTPVYSHLSIILADLEETLGSSVPYYWNLMIVQCIKVDY